MSVVAVVGIVVASFAALSAAGFIGYAYGSRLVEYEREGKAVYLRAHTAVSAKLAAVKAEIEQIEKSGYADVTSAVQRIKSIF